MSPRLRSYGFCLGGMFWLPLLGTLALTWHHLLPHLGQAAPLLAIAVLGEELVISQKQRSGSPMMSFSAPAHVAAVIVVGPTLAAAMAAAGVLISDGLRPDGRRFLLLNSAMLGMSTWVGGLVYVAIGGDSAARLSAGSLFPLLVLIVVRYLTTALIVAGGTALATGRSLASLLPESVREETGPGIGEGSLGVLLALALSHDTWVILPFLVPLLFALYRSKATLQLLQQETTDALNAIATVVDERDPNTARHSERVAEYVERFLDALQVPAWASARLVSAARFHDLGKLAVDVSTLSSSEPLSKEETQAILRHPQLSAHLLSPFHFAREMALYVELHHERFDGRGYYCVPGAELPMEANLLVIADSFDAMTSERPYRPALTLEEAADELVDKAGTQFHPLLARAFGALVTGRSVESELSAEELTELRTSLAGRKTFSLGRLSPALNLRLITVGLATLSLGLFGIAAIPTTVSLIAAVLAVALGTVWLTHTIVARNQMASARAVMASGGSLTAALAAAQIRCWTAVLSFDAEIGEYRPSQLDGVPDQRTLAEMQSWARRRIGRVETTANDGSWIVVTPALDGQRAAICALEAPNKLKRGLIDELLHAELARTASGGRPAQLAILASATHHQRATDKRPFTIELDLESYETVRTAAGQLVAERMVAEATHVLQSVLRPSDSIERVGKDTLSLTVWLSQEESLAPVRQRIIEAVSAIAVPKRVSPILPRLRTVPTGEQAAV